jgi:chromosome segregation ATPase
VLGPKWLDTITRRDTSREVSVRRAPTDTPTEQALAVRLVALESALAASNAELTEMRKERDFLRAAYDALKRELELLKRRIFIATAERVDNEQLKLEFKDKLELLNKMACLLYTSDAVDDRMFV